VRRLGNVEITVHGRLSKKKDCVEVDFEGVTLCAGAAQWIVMRLPIAMPEEQPTSC
jgi:hypothetical protein